MNKRFYNFGGFRLDTHNQRLLRGGEAITLTLKQFELLLALVENAGDVVTKDQLFEQVWKDVAVADETLTRNISWLRQKLGDGALIETVPKRGYRFAADVTTGDQPEIFVEETTLTRVRVEETINLSDAETRRRGDAEKGREGDGERGSEILLTNSNSVLQTAQNSDLQKSFSASPLLPLSASPRLRISASQLLAAAFAVIAAAAIGFIVYQNYFARRDANINFVANVKPFSGASGREDTPAFSPDGKQLAFSWNGGERQNSDIYVQIIGAGEPVRLTDTEVHEQYPVFSPDGTHIAFVRDYKTYGEIILIPALGGAERRIARLFSGNYSISFAPDGKSIAVVDAVEEGGRQSAIYTVDVKTGERRRITANGEFSGETTPRFSPDGKSLAFVRVFPDYAQDLFVAATGGENNEPRRLTNDGKTIHSLTWSADGAAVFFVSLRESNRPNIWRIGAAGGAPEILSIGGKDLTNLAASPDGKMLAFVENTKHSDIYRLKIGESQTKPLIATSYTEDLPDFSPDGRHIVFHSNRSGSVEAWIADADGRNLRQITDGKRQVGTVRFSPDGTQIAFHARDGENREIYVAPVEGGEPRRLTTDAASDVSPSWSADGKYIYFASDRTGENQLWRVSSTGGDAVRITRGGGFESFASPDGKWIYYTKNYPDIGLRRVSANATFDNSDETQIPEINDEGFQNAWTLAANGVYFIAKADKSPAKIKFYDFSTERIGEVAETDKFNGSGFAGMTVSPDGKTIVFAQFDQNASSIMLAEIKK